MATHAHTTPMPAAHPGSLRARMERAVEQMLAASERLMAELDAMQGDPDLEDGGDDEHNGDLEPSLGSVESWSAPQTGWAAGNSLDLEGEHDGREPSEDDEFTLGRTEGIDQTRPQWGSDDAEDVSEDEGAQCEDEGFESDREPCEHE